MQGELVSSGGLRINGLVKEYKVAAGENVNAGDFVSFVNHDTKVSNARTSKKQLTNNNNNGWQSLAIGINENSVLVLYNGNYYIDQLSKVHGVVCTIENNEITAGTPIQLATESFSGYGFSGTLLSENKAFIVFGDTFSGSGNLYGLICTINETTINAVKKEILFNNYHVGDGLGIAALTESKVFITNLYGSNSLYGVVCEVDADNNISHGTNTCLITSAAGFHSSVIKLNENKVFISTGYDSSNYYLRTLVCTINGTTITAGTNYSLVGSVKNSGYEAGLLKLDENKVLVLYNGANYLYGLICEIDGLAMISKGTTMLVGVSSTLCYAKPILLKNGNIFVPFSGDGGSYAKLNCIICKIKNDTITIKESVQSLTGENGYGNKLSATIFGEDKIFVSVDAYSGYKLNGLVYDALDKLIQIKNDDDRIYGVAKQKGSAGQLVKVYIPNLEGEI